MSSDVGSALKETAESAQKTVEHAAESQKGVLTQLLTDVANAVDAAAGELDSRKQGEAAQYVGAVGSALNGLVRSLDQKSVGEMMSELRDVARRNPTLFLGGGLLVGMAISRLAKASASRSHDNGALSQSSGQHSRQSSGSESGSMAMSSNQASQSRASGLSGTSPMSSTTPCAVSEPKPFEENNP